MVRVRVYQVLTETNTLDPAFEEALNDRLVLIFTGKQRLARSAGWLSTWMSASFGDGKMWTCLHRLMSKACGDSNTQLYFAEMHSERFRAVSHPYTCGVKAASSGLEL